MDNMTADKDLARVVLGTSLDARLPTADVAKVILSLLDIEDKKLFHNLKKLTLQSFDIEMSKDYKHPQRLSDSDLKALEYFFDYESLEDSLNDDLGDNDYFVKAANIMQSSFEMLGFDPVEWTPIEALQHWGEFREQNSAKWKKDEKFSLKRRKKALRLLARLQEFLEKYSENLLAREAHIMSKSRFSNRIDYEILSDESLSFVSYLTARAGRRSVFAAKEQSKAFDEIHEELFSLVEATNPSFKEWVQIALVYPTHAVLKHLEDEQLSILESEYSEAMETYAFVLQQLWENTGSLSMEARIHMACYKGTDTHRWNIYAGAFNTARSAVLSIKSEKAGRNRALADLSSFPGKAVRLMALDLMESYKYQNVEDSESFKDKALWFKLPFPWEILNGDAELPYLELEGNPGWLGPFSDIKTEEIEAEMPLVNGVVVNDPKLAAEMRKNGIFK